MCAGRLPRALPFIQRSRLLHLGLDLGRDARLSPPCGAAIIKIRRLSHRS